MPEPHVADSLEEAASNRNVVISRSGEPPSLYRRRK